MHFKVWEPLTSWIILANLQLLSTLPLKLTEMLQEHTFLVVILPVRLCQPEKRSVFSVFNELLYSLSITTVWTQSPSSYYIEYLLWVELPTRKLLLRFALRLHAETQIVIPCCLVASVMHACDPAQFLYGWIFFSKKSRPWREEAEWSKCWNFQFIDRDKCQGKTTRLC